MSQLYAVSRKRLIELLNKEEYLEFLIRHGQATRGGYEVMKNDPDQLDLFETIPYNSSRHVVVLNDPNEDAE